VDHPLGVGFAGAQDILPQDWDEQAAEWRDCGVRHVVLLHGSVMQRSLRNGLASMAPFIKIMRGLRKL
jgi:phthiodiolone/phenolphthiodiolone dimycocerosates ketoreductase